MPDEPVLEGLVRRYQSQPLLKALVQLVPIAAAFDSALLAVFRQYETERLRVFFDELGSGAIELTTATIESEDFLHCYFHTLQAAIRARRREKIRCLARLLKAVPEGDRIDPVDEYEELLAVLDELSYRELKILTILARHERLTPFVDDENSLQRALHFWPQFVREAGEYLGIQERMLQPMLTRLQRSGCYAELVGGFMDYEGGVGRLTPLWGRIEGLIGRVD